MGSCEVFTADKVSVLFKNNVSEIILHVEIIHMDANAKWLNEIYHG